MILSHFAGVNLQTIIINNLCYTLGEKARYFTVDSTLTFLTIVDQKEGYKWICNKLDNDVIKVALIKLPFESIIEFGSYTFETFPQLAIDILRVHEKEEIPNFN